VAAERAVVGVMWLRRDPTRQLLGAILPTIVPGRRGGA
jgi:hypothetical protein